jgi:hypothetical protein
MPGRATPSIVPRNAAPGWAGTAAGGGPEAAGATGGATADIPIIVPLKLLGPDATAGENAGCGGFVGWGGLAGCDGDEGWTLTAGGPTDTTGCAARMGAGAMAAAATGARCGIPAGMRAAAE